MSTLKGEQHESCEFSFSSGQNKDCSPGDSISDSFKKLCRRGRGQDQYMWFWWKGRTCNQAHIFFFFCRRFLPATRVVITRKDFSVFFFFFNMRRDKNWAHKINLQKYLIVWRPASFSQSTECLISALHPELLSVGMENQQLHMI